MPRTITMEISDELMKLLGSAEEIEKEAKQALVMEKSDFQLGVEILTGKIKSPWDE